MARSVVEGALDDAADVADVLPGGELGDDAAPFPVDLRLRGDRVRSARATGRSRSPLSETTAAAVSSHDVSMASTVVIGARRLRRRPPRRLSSKGGRQIPCSVTMPVTRSCGVTSKAGFQTPAPAGATRDDPRCVTSRPLRSSIGIASPSGVPRSMVEVGAAT